MSIFTLQRIERRLSRPMAWTVALALLGAMTFSVLIAPVLAGTFFRNGVKERRNPVMDSLTEHYRRGLRWAVQHRWVVAGVGFAALAGTIYLGFGGVIGAEFLPHLDEGAIWTGLDIGWDFGGQESRAADIPNPQKARDSVAGSQ